MSFSFILIFFTFSCVLLWGRHHSLLSRSNWNGTECLTYTWYSVHTCWKERIETSIWKVHHSHQMKYFVKFGYLCSLCKYLSLWDYYTRQLNLPCCSHYPISFPEYFQASINICYPKESILNHFELCGRESIKSLFEGFLRQ